ncbi:hypothetical protein ACQY0O_003867 [Thecaphora frezii]
MSFRLLFLATLLVLGVASVCANNQPFVYPQYSVQVNQGTLNYKVIGKNRDGSRLDQVCFEPNDKIWDTHGWTLSVWWAHSKDKGVINGKGKGCFGSEVYAGFYNEITSPNNGYIYFTFGYQHSQPTEHRWVGHY